MAPTIWSEVGIGQPPKEIRPPANYGAMGEADMVLTYSGPAVL